MQAVHSQVLSFKGSHYDFGFKQGLELIDSPIMKHREKLWGSQRKYHFSINQDSYYTVIMKFAPALWDELHGLADALKMPLEEAIVQFGGYYLEYGRSGCSIYTTDQFMVRNYDNHPNTYEGRYLIYQPTDSGYASLGPTMQITGRTDGMNERGLALGYNFVNRRGSADGFVCNMIGRIVLETCAKVEEAIDLLKELPHRHSFNYVLTDPVGKTYVVEASPRQVTVHESLICTNHFHHLTAENRYRMEDSLRREEIMADQASQTKTALDAFRLLNDDQYGIFSQDYGAFNGTLHTALYFPKTGKAGIALGSQSKPLILDFQQFLGQNPTRLTKIRGEIRHQHPFINEEF